MTDKEVGELWQDLQRTKAADIRGELYAEALIGLIRQLVEERREKYAAESDGKWDSLHYTAEVLDDFGIPEEGWLK